MCFTNEWQPNSQEHEDCSRWQRRKTWLLWPMWPYIQCFEQDIRASFKLFTRREDDSISKASFTAMTGDHHDELTAIDHSMICSDAIVIWINFKNYASLVIFFQPFLFCSVLFRFVFERELYILYECSLCSSLITFFWFFCCLKPAPLFQKFTYN